MKIGKFTISHKLNGAIHVVSISPGTLTMTNTKGETIHNKSCEHHENDIRYASYHWDKFIKYARNQNAFSLWQRLNKKPLAVYLRYQKLVARHTNGKWVRGLTIVNGHAKLNYE